MVNSSSSDDLIASRLISRHPSQHLGEHVSVCGENSSGAHDLQTRYSNDWFPSSLSPLTALSAVGHRLELPMIGNSRTEGEEQSFGYLLKELLSYLDLIWHNHNIYE